MAILFLISALLQYNDPDPLRWAALYGGAAIACVVSRPASAPWLLPAAVGLAALIWAGAMAPHVLPNLAFRELFLTMKAETPSIEESRELLGLLIIAAWMGVRVATGLRKRRRRSLNPARPDTIL